MSPLRKVEVMEIVLIVVVIALFATLVWVLGSFSSVALNVSLSSTCINQPVLQGNISMLNYPLWFWQFRSWRRKNEARIEQVELTQRKYSRLWVAEAEGFSYFDTSASMARYVIAARMFVADRVS